MPCCSPCNYSKTVIRICIFLSSSGVCTPVTYLRSLRTAQLFSSFLHIFAFGALNDKTQLINISQARSPAMLSDACEPERQAALPHGTAARALVGRAMRRRLVAVARRWTDACGVPYRLFLARAARDHPSTMASNRMPVLLNRMVLPRLQLSNKHTS